ncbi:unnamed protein product [Thlaspi arvense]|uniref:Alkyl transferase n=1 Tax=Thlaspi arvense TaxID=13288 RepID=A0AAU9SR91_THLAR|nr:unnamed protein product [Thlaspi arvense]
MVDERTNVVGEEELLRGLRGELMPRHVAVIMDGNRRWAKQAGLLTSQGHEAGAKRLIDEEIRVSVIGNLANIPESLLGVIKETEEATKSYKKKHLILAIDYSGRFDILHACKSLMKKSDQGLIREEDVDQTLFERELLTNCTEFPSPDLLIRTSGEERVSNFFLWQLAYTELFFSPVLWPDFDKDKLLEALTSYQRRERRFGCRARVLERRRALYKPIATARSYSLLAHRSFLSVDPGKETLYSWSQVLARSVSRLSPQLRSHHLSLSALCLCRPVEHRTSRCNQRLRLAEASCCSLWLPPLHKITTTQSFLMDLYVTYFAKRDNHQNLRTHIASDINFDSYRGHIQIRFYLWSNPIIGREGENGEDLDSPFTAKLDDLSQSFNAGSVTIPRLKTSILRPSSVSVHYNRHVLRHQLRLESLRQSFFLRRDRTPNPTPLRFSTKPGEREGKQSLPSLHRCSKAPALNLRKSKDVEAGTRKDNILLNRLLNAWG